jgi:hypothetical protein
MGVLGTVMGKGSTSEQLRQLCGFVGSRDISKFAAQVRPLLEADFNYWFKVLKEQKLLNKFRRGGDIEELRGLLGPPLRSTLTTAENTKLEHHFEVGIFMQEVFAQIDRETDALPCSGTHPEILARAVLRMIEVANYGFQKNAVSNLKQSSRITALQLANMNRRLRDVLDTGNVIINAHVSRTGTSMDYTVTDADLNELVRLALLFDEMRQVFDLYTYQNVEISINRRSLVLRRTDHETNLAAAVGAERSTDNDHIRGTFLSKLEMQVRDDCHTIAAGSTGSFFKFLGAVADSTAISSARDFFQAFMNDLRSEVDEFFDLSTNLQTSSGKFTVEELIRAWAFFVTLAMLGQQWNESRAKIVPTNTAKGTKKKEWMIREVPVPELHRNWLIRLLAREANLSRQQSRCLINQFTSEFTAGRIDLFYKPLLALRDNVMLLPTPYIRGSRFERNLFTLIATETELDQKKKGYLPVLELQNRFKEGGFRSLSNYRVQINHREITDIDLVAFKDGILFLGQCKIVIEPDTVYDAWKIEQKLDLAATQLDTCVAHLGQVRETLFERFGLKGMKEDRVVPFILTNTRQFTERRFRGHQVVDIPYLRFLLAGARPGIIAAGRGKLEFGSGRSYIKGEFPTGAELANLLVATLHKVQKREITYRHVMKKIGDRKVHIPMMAMRTAGNSYMIVTRDNVFKDGEHLPL